MLNFRDQWDEMTPKNKQILALGGGGLLLLGVISIFTTGGSTATTQAQDTSVDRAVFSDSNTRALGVDALVDELAGARDQYERLEASYAELRSQIEEDQKRRGWNRDLERELAAARGQIAQLTEVARQQGFRLEQLKEDQLAALENDDGFVQEGVAQTIEAPEGVNVPLQPLAPVEVPVDPTGLGPASLQRGYQEPQSNAVENLDPVSVFAQQQTGWATSPLSADEAEQTPFQITSVTGKTILEKAAENKDSVGYIPSGAILSGVLLSGGDFPTSTVGKKDPYPTLVRIQKEAILPNYGRSDVRECFTLLSGYGDLSSERVFLRGQKVTCLGGENNEFAIEADLKAYVTDHTGKNGILSRIVHRNGALLARTLAAGFWGGLSEALGGQPAPQVITGAGTGDQQYLDTFNSDSAQYGVAQGASKALEKLSDYYLSLASQVFPVASVPAGTKVNIIVTEGFELKVVERLVVGAN